MSDLQQNSPFAEKKSGRIVWILPSVVLHAVILIAWLLMPKEPPRKPGERKLTIRPEQAEQLQQHVTDANLVMLQSRVSELQEIKQAMAQIRDGRMQRLRNFEEEMMQSAPADAREQFSRHMEAQQRILKAQQAVLENVRESSRLIPEVKKVLEGKDPLSALPMLSAIQSAWNTALEQLIVIEQENAVSYAHINSGEVKLEWITDPAVQRKHGDLLAAMKEAESENTGVQESVRSAYTGSQARILNEVSRRLPEFLRLEEAYAAAELSGTKQAERKREETRQRIAAMEKDVAAKKTEISEWKTRNEALDKGKDQRRESRSLSDRIRSLGREVAKMESQIKKERAELEKISYRPDKTLQRDVDHARTTLEKLFAGPQPDPDNLHRALTVQSRVTFASKELLESITAGVSP